MFARAARACVSAVLTSVFLVAPHPSFGFPVPLHGAGAGTRVDPYVIPKISGGLAIDGIPNEAVWEKALVLELPYETTPGENVPAHVRTEGLLLYDHACLYVAFRCQDPDPGAIRSYLRDRDSGWDDDRAVVVLDTFDDERRSVVFGVNALGVQSDYYEDSSGESDIGWDTIWDSATEIGEEGWTAEMAIPFRSISFQRSSEPQVWGVVLARQYPRSLQYWFANSPKDRNDDCSLCQAAKIIGFEGAAPGRNIEIAPTVTGVRTEEREVMPDGDFRKRNQDAEAGVTARWGLTPNLTMTGAVNPDFSQVEADALQLDINEPFALFYEERRPFFTEGIDLFNTNLNAVHTRTMRDPEWGLQLTGKEGSNTIGAYVVRDNVTNLIFPGSQSSGATSLELASTASVVRYKRDLGPRYTLGLLATGREAEDYHNRLGGVDADIRITHRDRIQLQALASSTVYPEETAAAFGQDPDALEDWALDAGYRHSSRDLHWWVNYKNLGEGFRSDLGFIPQVDYRRWETGVSRLWWGGRGRRYSSLELSAGYEEAEDQGGGLLWRVGRAAFCYRGPLQSFMYIHGERKREAYNGQEFDQNTLFTMSWIRPTGNIYIALTTFVGNQIDYANTRLGDVIRLESEVNWNIGRRLRLEVAHDYERLEIDASELYTAHSSQLAAFYHFNPRSFVRGILQYADYDRNMDLYTFPVEPESQTLFSQFLFSYKINPRTVLFLGYGDNHLGTREHDLTRSDRTVFGKIGYAFRA